jgi:hypothetical protein
MQKLKNLVKISSKENFYKLRELWEIKCFSINKNFKVTWLFLRHISWVSRNRVIRDIIERLSSIALVEKIAKKWELIEIRNKVQIEKFNYAKSYKIKLQIENIDFYLILAEKNNWTIILISVFLNYIE